MTLLLYLSIYTLEKEMLRLICVSDLCGSQRTRKHFRRSISLFQSNKTNLCCLNFDFPLFLRSSERDGEQLRGGRRGGGRGQREPQVRGGRQPRGRDHLEEGGGEAGAG